MAFFQLLLMSTILMINRSLAEENTTLLLVQTLFRHSDRAPVFIYPNDPNNPEVCWPNGLGKLTQLGKMQHYAVGKFLRSMYKDFITTNPREVYSNSSSEDRCLNSVESNLASFYAPDETWQFEENFDWQPIPIHYLPAEMDKYLNFDSPCPRADAECGKLLHSSEILDMYQTHQGMVENITKFSGLNYTNGPNPLFLYDTLEVEKLHNLIIPEWVDAYWDEMGVIASAVFRTFFSSYIQLKLRVGPFLEVVTQNLIDKVNGQSPYLKVVMNSAHDLNVGALLLALNFTDMPRPPYCATVFIELHEMSDASMAVRLLYMNSTEPLRDVEDPHVLVMYGCTEFCPLETFLKSFQDLIPYNWTEECKLKN